MQWLLFGILTMIVVTGVRRMAREAAGLKAAAQTKPFSASAEKKSQPAALDIQETVQCSVCQAYIVKNAASCGRANCPFGA